MVSFFRLIRLPNLIIIALTQTLVRYCLIFPAYITEYHQTHFFPLHLSKIGFSLLVLSTVLIAAAGYIINDVSDTGIDEINKPGENLIGKVFSEKFARNIYYIFSLSGVLIGFYLAVMIQRPVMGFMQLFAAVSLWLYSSYYKKRLFAGNIIIALISALAVLIVALYEPSIYPNMEFILYYSVFAFLVSLIREIIKDAEDIDGDERSQRKTIPIIFGIKTTKTIVTALILVTSAGIVFILYKYFYTNKVVNFSYLIGMFLVPFAALAYLVQTAGEKKDYHYASTFTKGIMIYGVLSMIPFWHYFLK